MKINQIHQENDVDPYLIKFLNKIDPFDQSQYQQI
jgi:hypothetical protein